MGHEALLHYTWRHKLLPLKELRTTDGRLLEVVDAGLYNRTDAGPDFFNAKVKVDGMLWVGNVELHIKASDWFRHHHDKDQAYDNVVLHVVTEADMDVTTSQGKVLPTVVIPISDSLRQDYEELIGSEKYPPCYKVIPSIPRLKVHSWMSALQTERLERKTKDIEKRVGEMGGSWEDAYFATLARNFGFGVNGDAFEVWAKTIPMSAVAHHRDDLFQVEAMFLGIGGHTPTLPSREWDEVAISSFAKHVAEFDVDGRYAREFAYLQKKFGLEPMDGSLWRYLRTRPQNFPHVRLLQLAKMYHERRTSLAALLDCKDVKEIGKLYDMKGAKLELLVINTAVPTIFAYGRHHAKESLCEKAFDLLESLKAEDNNIVRMWQECGLDVKSAGDSQALIQLKKEYCDRKECLRCRFGYEFLTGDYRNRFLAEEEHKSS